MLQLVRYVLPEDDEALLFNLKALLAFACRRSNHVLEVINIVNDDSLGALGRSALGRLDSNRSHFKLVLRVVSFIGRSVVAAHDPPRPMAVKRVTPLLLLLTRMLRGRGLPAFFTVSFNVIRLGSLAVAVRAFAFFLRFGIFPDRDILLLVQLHSLAIPLEI